MLKRHKILNYSIAEKLIWNGPLSKTRVPPTLAKIVDPTFVTVNVAIMPFVEVVIDIGVAMDITAAIRCAPRQVPPVGRLIKEFDESKIRALNVPRAIVPDAVQDSPLEKSV